MATRVVRPEDVDKVADVLAAAFRSCPLNGYMVRRSDSTWSADNIPVDVLRPHFRESTAKKLAWGAEVVEAGDWAAVAIWFPPGTAPAEGPDADPRILEFRETFARVKKEHLEDRPYWYLNVIGRHPERREPGAVRALIDPYLQRARAQGLPVWLEAVTEHSRQVYKHLGFREVAQVRIAVSKANARGEFQEGGEGLLIYGMIAE
ncbi:hypothetical protein VTN77DRAFT_2209 [Rasamsonia byssochlamydoides]|uniref:uncharacterized protein n=1 Tax=Rasamsonia byssochlamydoides TaxID=89139 RepID=UPI0037432ADA